MPIYLYRCRHCGNKIEMFKPMNGKDSQLACPECGTRELEKLILPFYGGLTGGLGGGFSIG